MNAGRAARWTVLAGLAAIVGLLLYPGPTGLSLAASSPLMIAFAAGFRTPPRWGGWVAALVIPYFAFALGEAIATPQGRAANWSITLLTIVVFLAAFAHVRATGTSLRR